MRIRKKDVRIIDMKLLNKRMHIWLTTDVRLNIHQSQLNKKGLVQEYLSGIVARHGVSV